MAKEKNDLITRLRSGEKVTCPKCKEGIFIPYNITFDKAHFFYCSNEKCNFHVHWDPVINIE